MKFLAACLAYASAQTLLTTTAAIEARTDAVDVLYTFK